MQECVTEALVLLKEPFSEYDARITLYTRLNGKLWAKAKSVRKITSKLNAHLEPGMVTLIRLTTRKDDHVGKDLNWYLEIDANEATICKIKTNDENEKTFTISKDKKFSGSSTCLTPAISNYYLKIDNKAIAYFRLLI